MAQSLVAFVGQEKCQHSIGQWRRIYGFGSFEERRTFQLFLRRHDKISNGFYKILCVLLCFCAWFDCDEQQPDKFPAVTFENVGLQITKHGMVIGGQVAEIERAIEVEHEGLLTVATPFNVC